jgi:hypothetical protein
MGALGLVAGLLTWVGLIAGGAILASAWVPQLGAQLLVLWLIFMVFFVGGVLAQLMFGRTSGALGVLNVAGYATTLLGVAALLAGLGSALTLFKVHNLLSVWMLALLALPVGVSLVAMGGLAERRGEV